MKIVHPQKHSISYYDHWPDWKSNQSNAAFKLLARRTNERRTQQPVVSKIAFADINL